MPGSAPIILVPGFWLGAWAWDEVAGELNASGHDVTALTLPGLESPETDRAGITFQDHVDSITAAVRDAGRPVVLAVHSGTGFTGYAASDAVPEQIAAMVYVDSAPGVGAFDAEFTGVEMPLDWEQLTAEESLAGVSEERLAAFRDRAVPEPGGVVRGAAVLRDDARLDIPSTFVCTSFTAADYRGYAEQGVAWLGGIRELRDMTWVDLPTGHWPMWSRPQDLAAVIADVARRHTGGPPR